MQIEQTFRDVKIPRWELGLSDSQTRQPERFANLLLIGALPCYALCLIALAVRASGHRNGFGGMKKQAQAPSLMSLSAMVDRKTGHELFTRTA